MQEEKQGTDTFLFPKGSPKKGYHDNSTAPSSLQNSQDNNDHFEAKENQNINGKLESVKYNLEKSDIEKMSTEHNTNSVVMNESPSNKIDEKVDEQSAKLPIETSDIEKMNIENNTTPPVLEESQPSKIDERPDGTKLPVETSDIERMNTENISNPLAFQKSPQDKAKADEEAHSKDHLPISTSPSQSTSYSSQFVLHNVPSVSSVDELASAIKHELQKYGEVVKIESQIKSENLMDVNLSFKHEKDAIKALMSNAKIHLGEQDFVLNIIPGFKDYLVKLSSTVKRPSNSQTAAKQKPEITKSESVIKENSVQNEERNIKKIVVNPSKNELSRPTNDNKLNENKKIIIKASGKRNEVPLEIRKPTKSAKSITNASSNEKNDSSHHLAPPVANVSNSQQKRSRTKSKSREKERGLTLQEGKPELKGDANTKIKSDRSLSRKSKKLAKRKELRDSSQQARQAKTEQRKESFNREENKNKDKDLHIEKKNIESTRNLDRKDNLLVIKKARPDHKDTEKANHHNHHHHHQNHRANDRTSWTDDEIPCEFVCYTVGIPLECDISFIRDFLQREGFYPHIKMQWKNFEGLDYLKLVFDSKSETQKFLSRQISLYEIPIIVLPKLPNKNPLEMLGYHQLRVESLSGPIESESVYEFLLKFGPITDFLVLDSMNSPTTFLVTFTNNSSKRTLESYYSKAPALLADKYNNERQLKVEFNIKPALVVRKKLNMTIIHQYKEAQRQIQAPIKQQLFEEETIMNQVPTPNSVINSFNMQGPPITQINNVVSPIPSTRSGSIHYSPPNPGYMNPNYVNENQGYFNMPQQGGYAYPRQDPVIYNPNQSINNFPNYEPNINPNQDLQRNMLPVYQVPQVPQRFENPVQNLYMGNPNQMVTTQTFGMPQVVNNGMYGNTPSPYTDMRMNGNYPVGGNQYSFPNQDGRNNMQYFY